MGHIVSSKYAMNLLLKPLGIDIKHLKKCTIEFNIDDAVCVTTEHFLEEPIEEAQTLIKRFYLAELDNEVEKDSKTLNYD